MLKYKIIVLGSLTSPDRIFEVSCDVVIYEHESIVFKKRILIKKDKSIYDLVTMLAIPQGASIVELQTLDLNE